MLNVAKCFADLQVSMDISPEETTTKQCGEDASKDLAQDSQSPSQVDSVGW